MGRDDLKELFEYIIIISDDESYDSDLVVELVPLKNKNANKLKKFTLIDQNLDLLIEDEDDLITECPFTKTTIKNAAKANVSYSKYWSSKKTNFLFKKKQKMV